MVANENQHKQLGTLYGFELPGFGLQGYQRSTDLLFRFNKAIPSTAQGNCMKAGVHIYNDIDDGTFVNNPL